MSSRWPFLPPRPDSIRHRLIFALDVETFAEAERLVTLLAKDVGVFKVGKQLFLHSGPEVVRMIHRHGLSITMVMEKEQARSRPHPGPGPGEKEAARHLGDDLLHRGERVLRIADRAAEDEVIGAGAHRLLGRHDALLVVLVAAAVAPGARPG